jgi:hypothetical protein
VSHRILAFLGRLLLSVIITGGMFVAFAWIWTAGLSWQAGLGLVCCTLVVLALLGTEY